MNPNRKTAAANRASGKNRKPRCTRCKERPTGSADQLALDGFCSDACRDADKAERWEALLRNGAMIIDGDS